MSLLEKFKNTKFYLGCVKLLRDLKPMTWQKRVDHIWTYYKEYIYCFCIAMVFVAFFFTAVGKQTEESLVSGIIVNVSLDQGGMNYLSQDYKAELAPDDKKKLVELDYTAFGDPMDPQLGEQSYYASMILTARVSGALLDYMILDKFAMEYYIAQEVYLDLRKVFTPEELAELDAQNKVIYAMQENNTERWPVAIVISDLPFIEDNQTSEGDVYFALSGNVRSLETCRNVWERILAWQSKEE